MAESDARVHHRNAGEAYIGGALHALHQNSAYKGMSRRRRKRVSEGLGKYAEAMDKLKHAEGALASKGYAARVTLREK